MFSVPDDDCARSLARALAALDDLDALIEGSTEARALSGRVREALGVARRAASLEQQRVAARENLLRAAMRDELADRDAHEARRLDRQRLLFEGTEFLVPWEHADAAALATEKNLSAISRDPSLPRSSDVDALNARLGEDPRKH